jgi:hypothetical protein
LDFHPSPADPCLYIKKAKDIEPPAYIILYVDDGVIFGTPKIIEHAGVFLVLLHSCVVLLYLGNQKHVAVLPYHPQKLNTMLVLKQPKK